MELIGAGRGRGGEEALPSLPLFFHSYRIPPLFFSRHPLFMYLSPPAFTSILPPSEHPSTSPSTPRSVLPRSALCAALTRPIFAPPPFFFPPIFFALENEKHTERELYSAGETKHEIAL